MNIVYGGSFNPPTLAHKMIVDRLKEEFRPLNLIIIPTGSSYERKELIPFKYRLDMLKLMFNDCIISDIEEKNHKYLGTLKTLDMLSVKYDDLYFVMGADNLIDIKTWINYEKLLEKYNFIIMTRNDTDVLSFIENEIPKYKNHFKLINVKYDISSSLVRSDLEKYKSWLDNKVYDYIIKNKLYQGDKNV